MKEVTYVIKDELGIHARPAAQLVKAISGFKSTITIEGAKGSADMKRLMALMKLSVKKDESVTVKADGEDENEAIKTLQEFFEANL